MRKSGERIGLREKPDLAKKAFALHESGKMNWEIAIRLQVSEPTAANLVGFGRRLAAGQPERLTWR